MPPAPRQGLDTTEEGLVLASGLHQCWLLEPPSLTKAAAGASACVRSVRALKPGAAGAWIRIEDWKAAAAHGATMGEAQAEGAEGMRCGGAPASSALTLGGAPCPSPLYLVFVHQDVTISAGQQRSRQREMCRHCVRIEWVV